MAYGIVKTEELSDIADAIRAKLGVQTQYKRGQMAGATELFTSVALTVMDNKGEVIENKLIPTAYVLAEEEG